MHQELAGLTKYFAVTEDRNVAAAMLGDAAPSAWLLECHKCGGRWRLEQKADGTIHPGNILKLLNHAVGHQQKRRTA